MLFDQPHQRLQRSVRVGGQLKPGEQGLLVESFQFPGSQEPLALFQVTETGGR